MTDLSIYAVTTLAEFYGVTTDYLLGVTENSPDAVLTLHLSDGAVGCIKEWEFQSSAAVRASEHPDFSR